MPPSRLPFVLFLDIDRTLIGRAASLASHYLLQRVIAESRNNDCTAADVLAGVPADYAEALVRPGLSAALDSIRAALKAGDGYDSLEVFICSMGQKGLVADVKVPLIEAVAGVKFNRPLFCVSSAPDENCQATADAAKKLVYKCFCTAISTLAVKNKRWSHLSKDIETTVKQLHATRFLMIDDTRDVAWDAASNRRVLVCPPYERMPRWDVLAKAGKSSTSRPHLVRKFIEDNKGTLFASGTPEVVEEGEDDIFWPKCARMFSAVIAEKRVMTLSDADIRRLEKRSCS